MLVDLKEIAGMEAAQASVLVSKGSHGVTCGRENLGLECAMKDMPIGRLACSQIAIDNMASHQVTELLAGSRSQQPLTDRQARTRTFMDSALEI